MGGCREKQRECRESARVDRRRASRIQGDCGAAARATDASRGGEKPRARRRNLIRRLTRVMQPKIQLLQHLHAESQHMDQASERRGSPTHAAGIPRSGPIMASHYQSESGPGRPNEGPHGRGWPPRLHTETREGLEGEES